MADLKDVNVAILVDDGFEEVELVEPWKALHRADARIRIVSPKPERVRGWKFTDWGNYIPVDVPLDQAQASEFDALLLPGGVIESRLSTYPTKGGRVRKVVLRCRKTGRLDLPRALDDHRDRRGTRTKGYLMAIAED